MVNNEVMTSSYILAGLFRKGEKDVVDMKIEECQRLMEATGITCVATIFQYADRPDAGMIFKSGKIIELENLVQQTQAEGIVFAHEISVSAAENLSNHFEIPVLDRTSLILMIFSERARSKQAKLQVEAARLAYAMPGLSERYDDNETHIRGGGYRNRGSGETRSALIRRKNRQKIKQIQDELALIESREQIAEHRRGKTRMKRVALVGYTNAGKSSLMNGMLERYGIGKPVSEQDRLFETLDASVRRITYDGHTYFLYDTVGFVSDLPHGLVEAFKTTLSGAVHADLLVHVIAGNESDWQEKAQITEETLRQIGAKDIPILRIYTKSDLGVLSDIDGITISSKTDEGIETFAKAVNHKLYGEEVVLTCLIPYAKMSIIDVYRDALKMHAGGFNQEGQYWQIIGEPIALRPFKAYERKKEEYEDSLEES